MKHSSQSCFEIAKFTNINLLKQCELHNTVIDCEKIFKPIVTDYGICCGANTRKQLTCSQNIRITERGDFFGNLTEFHK